MERAQILKQRLDQQIERERMAANEMLSRTTARLVRPLIEQKLLHFAAILGGTIETVTEIPTHKLENDRRTIIFTQPIRDYLTTKAFTLTGLDALFILHIGYQQVNLDLIGRRYRHRGRFEGTADGVWLPPGDYTETMALAETRWSDDDAASSAIETLFTTAETQIPAIRLFASTAAREARSRRRLTFQHRAVRWTAGTIYVVIMIALLAWCVMAMYFLLRYGPNVNVPQ